MKKIIIAILILLSINTALAKNIDIQYNNGIYHIVLDGNKIKKKIKFIATETLMTNAEIHKLSKSKLTINTGFFDPQNGKTISFIVTDGDLVADPRFNDGILLNPVLKKNMDKILNRTEFRVVECDSKYHYEIAQHRDKIDFGCNIVTSAQGGPMILPELRLEEEFFIVKDEEGNITRESASVLHKVARTIIGIKDGNAHILIITDKHPMDMYEVQALCKQLGFERAMAFDGGSSTSMNYKKQIEVVSTVGDGGGRLLKSFMIIK